MSFAWARRGLETKWTKRDLRHMADMTLALSLTDEWRSKHTPFDRFRHSFVGPFGTLGAVGKDDFTRKQEDLQYNLTAQVTRLFTALEEVTNPESVLELMSEDANLPTHDIHTKLPPNRYPMGRPKHRVELDAELSIDAPNPLEVLTSTYMQERVGWSLSVSPSDIPGAGRGLFVNGAADTGAVVAIMGGMVVMPQALLENPPLLNFLHPDVDAWMYSRFDGIIIDGRWTTPSPMSEKEFEYRAEFWRNLHDDSVQVFPYAAPNPLGVGGLTNHPPPDTPPNVMAINFDFPAEDFNSCAGVFPNHLDKFIPNCYMEVTSVDGADVHAIPGVRMPSALLIALRPLENEELYVDYRFNPIMERPAWYEPVNEMGELERWSDDMAMPI